MPEILQSGALPPDGSVIRIPPLDDATTREFRLVLKGSFSVQGESFDALYLSEGATPHNYLRWTPAVPELVREDRQAHEYEYVVRPGSVPPGQSLSVQLDLDRLIDRFLITRSEVIAATVGEIQLSVTQLPLVTPFPWPLALGIGAPLALVLGGVGWVARRRMLLQGIPTDLLQRVERIQSKAQRARQAAAHQSDSLPIRERLDTLAGASLPLARQAADLRSAQRLADRETLEREIAGLKQRLEILTAGGSEEAEQARRETGATLAEKQKARERLDDLARAEALCTLRLEKIEAVLDSAALTLRAARARSAEPASEEHLRQSLDAEVTAVHQVAKEAPRVELLIGTRRSG